MHLDTNDDNEERALFGMINKATNRAVSKKLKGETILKARNQWQQQEQQQQEHREAENAWYQAIK